MRLATGTLDPLNSYTRARACARARPQTARVHARARWEQWEGGLRRSSNNLALVQVWHPSHGYVNNSDDARGEYFRDYKAGINSWTLDRLHSGTVLTHTRTYARMHDSGRMHTYACPCTHVLTRKHTYASTHAYAHTCTHSRTHSRTHAHIHARTHTRTHDAACVLVRTHKHGMAACALVRTRMP